MLKDKDNKTLTNPRCRLGSRSLLRSNIFHQGFFRNFPEYKDKYTMKEVTNVVMTFCDNLLLTAIENRDGVEFPEGLGHLYMGNRYPLTEHNKDNLRKFTKKIGIPNITNLHSEGRVLKIMYSNFGSTYRFKQNEMWFFKVKRLRRKIASNAFGDMYQKYVVVENYKKIKERKDLSRAIEHYEKAEKRLLKDYNEFYIE